MKITDSDSRTFDRIQQQIEECSNVLHRAKNVSASSLSSSVSSASSSSSSSTTAAASLTSINAGANLYSNSEIDYSKLARLLEDLSALVIINFLTIFSQ